MQPIFGQDNKKKGVSSLEIKGEIQAGNNETLISLFHLECDKTAYAGCLSEGGAGFFCGCHERKCKDCEVKSAVDVDGAEVRGNGRVDQEHPELRALEATVETGFSFVGLQFDRCKRMYCAEYSQCRCLMK